jgi:hypothetical protein
LAGHAENLTALASLGVKGGGVLLRGGALLRCLCGGGTFTAMSVEAVLANDAWAFLVVSAQPQQA